MYLTTVLLAQGNQTYKNKNGFMGIKEAGFEPLSGN